MKVEMEAELEASFGVRPARFLPVYLPRGTAFLGVSEVA